MAEFHFAVTGETLDVIEQLRVDLNATSNAGVFRKALALAKLFAETANEDGIVLLYGADASKAIAIDLRN